MYQKFLLEVFYPSNLLEIFLGCISSCVSGVIGSSQVAPFCARIVLLVKFGFNSFSVYWWFSDETISKSANDILEIERISNEFKFFN